MDKHIQNLRDQAAHCLKLARSTQHRPTAAMFERMAAEYEVQADRLEARQARSMLKA